ncbi:hypothetical protein J2M53_04000 [Arthrobacter sp. zg-ZUI100]|uniref:Uncharacterized protein n=1 Tax=Arthrobacter jiangjiafuii TaxID=2817475 RepID=A0A975M4L1_9MICC|nr:hypothetical protein [Arthrobacter jiangjiafuii]MBP3035420.1 hypothetical protein [Arthrobacter jiangjiafuii]MBP3042380.1 hypothetical protein [Arthrobacter jiangjiafuii]QWC09868.1 hypothetical protein KKR91_15635 [Arthrobacter jiangjiafuii]
MPVVSTPAPATTTRAKRVRNIRSLHRGDLVEVRSGKKVYYSGEVRDTAPGLGTIWIRTDEDGTRTSVSVEDYTIWKNPS